MIYALWIPEEVADYFNFRHEINNYYQRVHFLYK